MLALSLTLTLSACAGSPSRAVLQRSLPPAPAFMAPVAMPQAKAGEQAKAFAGRCVVALDGANGNLGRSRLWYGDLVKQFGQSKP